MTTRLAERPEHSIDVVQVPSITMLGAIDDANYSDDMELDAAQSKPIFAIIYNGI